MRTAAGRGSPRRSRLGSVGDAACAHDKQRRSAVFVVSGTTAGPHASVVTHTRRVPIKNRFRYKASYWLVDYDELPELAGLIRRLARFERSDHGDVRALLAEQGVTADRILMLAMLRTLGYVFNPISVFWCYDAAGGQVASLAEVHNTYGERHTYLLRPDGPTWSRSSTYPRFFQSMATTTFG
jgi:uncharacterized protein